MFENGKRLPEVDIESSHDSSLNGISMYTSV